MYTPEDHQKHVGRAKTTLCQRQIRLLCIAWLHCMRARCRRWAHAGSLPSVSKPLLFRPLRWRHAVHLLPACDVFHNPDSFFFMRGLCLVYTCPTGTNEFRACALLVPSVRLALVWRSSGVYIHTWKSVHIFEHAVNVCRGWRTQ